MHNNRWDRVHFCEIRASMRRAKYQNTISLVGHKNCEILNYNAKATQIYVLFASRRTSNWLLLLNHLTVAKIGWLFITETHPP